MSTNVRILPKNDVLGPEYGACAKCLKRLGNCLSKEVGKDGKEVDVSYVRCLYREEGQGWFPAVTNAYVSDPETDCPHWGIAMRHALHANALMQRYRREQKSAQSTILRSHLSEMTGRK